MYYHRCMAYKAVLKYEQEHNMKFDWVVLVRLDAQWLDPVLPIESYASDRVWLTETGYVLLNDQFMLIPRQFSDYLYDLDTKVEQKGVYCLGGPDVETSKCDERLLRSRGVSELMINATLRRCCSDVLKLLASPSRKGINEEGFSETIHLRHLAMGKIPVALAYFPVLLTRLQGKGLPHVCNPECGRLYYNAKEYFFSAGQSVYPNFLDPVWPDTRFRPLTTRDQVGAKDHIFLSQLFNFLTCQVVCEMVNSPEFEWDPIPAEQFHSLLSGTGSGSGSGAGSGSGGRYRVDYSKSLYQQQRDLHPSILLPSRELQVFRLHPSWNAEGCLTYNLTSKTTVWDECTEHFRKRGGLRVDPAQLFFLQVEVPHYPSYTIATLPDTQTAADDRPAYFAGPSAFDVSRRTEIQLRGRHDFLSLNPNVVFRSAMRNLTRVMLLDRDPHNWNFIKVLCLTASGLKLTSPLTMEPCAKKGSPARRMQEFLSVKGTIDGSHPLTTIGTILLAISHPANIISQFFIVGHLILAAAPQFCVSRYFNYRVNTGTDEDARDSQGVVSSVADYPSKGILFLHNCKEEGRLFLTKFEFEKIII